MCKKGHARGDRPLGESVDAIDAKTRLTFAIRIAFGHS